MIKKFLLKDVKTNRYLQGNGTIRYQYEWTANVEDATQFDEFADAQNASKNYFAQQFESDNMIAVEGVFIHERTDYVEDDN